MISKLIQFLQTWVHKTHQKMAWFFGATVPYLFNHPTFFLFLIGVVFNQLLQHTVLCGNLLSSCMSTPESPMIHGPQEWGSNPSGNPEPESPMGHGPQEWVRNRSPRSQMIYDHYSQWDSAPEIPKDPEAVYNDFFFPPFEGMVQNYPGFSVERGFDKSTFDSLDLIKRLGSVIKPYLGDREKTRRICKLLYRWGVTEKDIEDTIMWLFQERTAEKVLEEAAERAEKEAAEKLAERAARVPEEVERLAEEAEKAAKEAAEQAEKAAEKAERNAKNVADQAAARVKAFEDHQEWLKKYKKNPVLTEWDSRDLSPKTAEFFDAEEQAWAEIYATLSRDEAAMWAVEMDANWEDPETAKPTEFIVADQLRRYRAPENQPFREELAARAEKHAQFIAETIEKQHVDIKTYLEKQDAMEDEF